MKNTKDKILVIAFIVCLILINILFIQLFDFWSSVLFNLLLIAPYLFIGIQYVLPKTKRTSIAVNKRIVQTAMLIFIAQILIFILFRIHNGLIVFLMLIAIFAYLIFFLRSIDSLVINWKTYHWQSKIFNSILIIYTLPLLFAAVFLRVNHLPTNNLPENEHSVSIKKEDLRFINAKTGKEVNFDSIMKPKIDSIIKNHKASR